MSKKFIVPQPGDFVNADMTGKSVLVVNAQSAINPIVIEIVSSGSRYPVLSPGAIFSSGEKFNQLRIYGSEETAGSVIELLTVDVCLETDLKLSSVLDYDRELVLVPDNGLQIDGSADEPIISVSSALMPKGIWLLESFVCGFGTANTALADGLLSARILNDFTDGQTSDRYQIGYGIANFEYEQQKQYLVEFTRSSGQNSINTAAGVVGSTSGYGFIDDFGSFEQVYQHVEIPDMFIINPEFPPPGPTQPNSTRIDLNLWATNGVDTSDITPFVDDGFGAPNTVAARFRKVSKQFAFGVDGTIF